MRVAITWLITFVASFAQAQVKSGTFFLGGSVGFRYSERLPPDLSLYQPGVPSLKEPKNTSYSLLPQLGFFLSEKWAIGITANYERNSQKSDYVYAPSVGDPLPYSLLASNGKLVQQSWAAGIFGQYYCMITNKFGLVFTTAAQYGKKKDAFISFRPGYVRPDEIPPPPPNNSPPMYILPIAYDKPQFVRFQTDAAVIYFLTPGIGITLRTTCLELYSQNNSRTTTLSVFESTTQTNFRLFPLGLRMGLQWHLSH
jgi:hypothetical protein